MQTSASIAVDQNCHDAPETTLIMLDDNIDEIFLAKRKVRKEGMINRFIAEKNPEQIFHAMDDLVRQGVDRSTFLLLLDVVMPRLSGFEVLQMIRRHPDYHDVPVLMFSSSNSEKDIVKAYEAGANGYVVKPFSLDRFLAAVSTMSTRE